MKKIVLLFTMILGMSQIGNAQAIEVIGTGVKLVNSETLYFDDPSSIDHVVVEATSIFWGKKTMPEQARFFDSNEDYTVDFNLTENNLSTLVNNGGNGYWGYYTATFNDIDADGITLDKMLKGDSIKSFIAYVYRNGSGSVWSSRMNDHALLWLNGSENPLTYDFTVPASTGYRNFEVVVPFTDLASAWLRWANVTVTAGGESVNSEFQINNEGELLRIERLVLNSVPGDVTNVKVEIYSPMLALDGKEGDSFITGAVLVTAQELGCTLTQGYWKTHSEYGPASKPNDAWDLVGGPDALFFYSGQSYLDVLNTPPKKGNAFYILAHQYIAAELNFLDGAGIPLEVQDAFDSATDLFDNEQNTPGKIAKLKGKDKLRKMFIALAGVLEAYNSGPGHCDNSNDEKSALISINNEVKRFDSFSVYPNPINTVATISFKPDFSGNAKIDMYNSIGQRVTRLLDKNVHHDIPVILKLNVTQFNEGFYFLVLQSGSSRETKKIIINR